MMLIEARASEYIYCPSRQQRNYQQGNQRLDHHQDFGPTRQDRHVRRRECSAGVEGQEQIINKVRFPVVLTRGALGCGIHGHLRKQEGAVGVPGRPFSLVWPARIQTPVPGSEYHDVADPERCRGSQELWRSNRVSGYGRDQECERCDHRQGDHSVYNITKYLIE